MKTSIVQEKKMDDYKMDVQLICNGKTLNLSSQDTLSVLDSLDLSELKNDEFTDELSRSPNAEIREIVSRCPNLSLSTLNELSSDPSYKVRWNILSEPANLTRLQADDLIDAANDDPELTKLILTEIDQTFYDVGMFLLDHYSRHSDPTVVELVDQIRRKKSDLMSF